MADSTTITLETGVVLRITRPSALVMQDIGLSMLKSEPQVPEVWIEAKSRSEPNPNDPAYLAASRRYEAEYVRRLWNAALILGTSVDSLPEGFPGPDSTEWHGRVALMGIPLAEDADGLYVQWIQYKAGPADWARLLATLLRLIGTAEEDVDLAVSAFRSDAERGADNELLPAENSANGHRVPAPLAGVGPRIRGTRGGKLGPL